MSSAPQESPIEEELANCNHHFDFCGERYVPSAISDDLNRWVCDKENGTR